MDDQGEVAGFLQEEETRKKVRMLVILHMRQSCANDQFILCGKVGSHVYDSSPPGTPLDL